jgi:hypothetical protein
MATDGVKIIDGDTAHDTYWGIMDLYDSGATIETIRNKNPFPQAQEDYYDDFDYEIYTTAYALAIWEIGYMTDDVLDEVKKVIEKGACVKVWTTEYNAKEGKARQKELDKLWTKISSTNQKTRKIKKYKVITNFLFDINDILTFQLKDNNYCATVLFDIRQYRGECTYEFGKIVYKESKIPTVDDILNSEIIGSKIPSGHGMDMTTIFSIGMEEMMKQGGFEEIMKREAERTGSFIIGMDKTGVDHKDLINFTDKFHKIGNLKIRSEFKETGSMSGAFGFDDLIREFPDLDNYIKIFKADKFKIKDLIEQ